MESKFFSNKKYLKELFQRHSVFIIIFLFLILIRIPLLFYVHNYTLLGQDINLTNLGLLFWHNDLPSIDTLSVGENRNYLCLSNAYFLIPVMLYKIGIPFEFFIGLHILFGMPLLLLGIYVLSYTLFRDKWAASFSALYFHFGNWLFLLNNGYPFPFDGGVYYGDINYIFVVFFLVFLFQKRYRLAGMSSFILSSLNPTFGFNSSFILFVYSVFKLYQSRKLHDSFYGSIIAFFGLITSFIMVKLATPIYAPVSVLIRDFCIQASSHIVIHAHDTWRYMIDMSIIFGLMYCVYIFERRYREKTIIKEKEPHFIELTKMFAIIFVVYSVGVYFLLYISSPSLFIMVSPSKSIMIFCYFVSVYFAFILYSVILSRNIIALLIILLVIILLFNHLGKSGNGAPLVLLQIFLFIIGFVIFYYKNNIYQISPSILQKVVIFILVLYSGWTTTSIIFSERMRYSSALYDIELKIKDKLPKEAIMVPYFMQKSHDPDYIKYYSKVSPLRTYSRRGAIIYHEWGRNEYFNSQAVFQSETKNFKEAGIDLWGEIIEDASQAKRDNSLLYYTGISLNPCCSIARVISPIKIADDKSTRLNKYIDSLDIKGFMDYGHRIGATHIIIQRDPNMKIPLNIPIIVENSYFVVYKIEI